MGGKPAQILFNKKNSNANLSLQQKTATMRKTIINCKKKKKKCRVTII